MFLQLIVEHYTHSIKSELNFCCFSGGLDMDCFFFCPVEFCTCRLLGQSQILYILLMRYFISVNLLINNTDVSNK